MENFRENTYGERIAEIYDRVYVEYDQNAITTLKELVRGGQALELGIGTGRIALPLQASGVEVHGIDASEAMVARLRAKPGGESLPVTFGNFADVAVEGQFSLIYVMFNTFYGLWTQEEQIRCFLNVAAHLTPDGVFVIEAFFPDLARYQDGQTFRVVRIGTDEIQLDASQIDLVSQQITSQHIFLTEEGTRLFPVRLRYVWPAEFDLIARLASMKLKHRWANWQKEAFSAESGKHVSVFSH